MAVLKPVQAFMLLLLWGTVTSAVVLLNKYVLDKRLGNLPYPLTLTACHMLCCTVFAAAMISSGAVQHQPLSLQTYARSVVPIGALFAVVLWSGNAAFIHLSVSFIQMLKATMPVVVYGLSLMSGLAVFSAVQCANMLLITAGVFIASHGETFVIWTGVLLQALSIVCEAVRVTMIQILMQKCGLKLDAINTMLYISPTCLVFLLIPWASLEAEEVLRLQHGNVNLPLLAANMACAVALNGVMFCILGRLSALTMNVAGVVKDCVLIYASVQLTGSPVTMQQICGYSIALVGVFSYNRVKQLSVEVPCNIEGGKPHHELEVTTKAKGAEGNPFNSTHRADSIQSDDVSAGRDR